jgi:DNA-binding LytR/AlgR family response regulator
MAWAKGRPWIGAVAAGGLMSVPMALFVYGASWAISPPGIPAKALPQALVTVLVVCIAMCLLGRVMRQRTVVVPKSGSAPVKFLERVPLKLRGGELWAVEAEDHYLRLHTSKGQDLILMRLADAVAELEGIEGAQVHRSWWVARDAIADAKRSDGRATLTLKDGSEVPVSRTYARLLRERSWI